MRYFGPPDVERLKAAGDVPRLARALGHRRRPEVRRQAALALGELADRRAVEPLVAALLDDDRFVRRYAARALGQIGDARAVDPLIRALSDPDKSQRLGVRDQTVAVEATQALVRINDGRSARALLALVEENGRAREALLGIRDPRAVPILLEALADCRPIVRRAASAALAGEDRAQAAGPLTVLLEDEDADVRRAAARALARIGQLAVESLAEVLSSGKPMAREEAASVLGQIGGEVAAKRLAAAFADPASPVADAAEKALQQMGEAAIEPVVASLMGQEGPGRGRAARLLSSLGWQPDQTETGATYWAARKQWERCAAIGVPAVPVLARVLEDPTAAERAAAAEALGGTGVGQAVEPLIAYLRREKAREGREAAGRALAALYRSEQLSEEQRLRILGQREYIRALHQDAPGQHHDDPFGTTKNWGSDCGHVDRMTVPHTDEGIKITLRRRRGTGGRR